MKKEYSRTKLVIDKAYRAEWLCTSCGFYHMIFKQPEKKLKCKYCCAEFCFDIEEL